MEAAVAVMESEGVDVVFGCPGAAILPLYAALQHSGIRHLTVRHEEGGTHAADGWARATGKVGVSIGTSGPAGTNMITGLYTALADSIPIICLTGQAPRSCTRRRSRPSTSWRSPSRSPSGRCSSRSRRRRRGSSARRSGSPGPAGPARC